MTPISWLPLDSADAVAHEACSRILRAAGEATGERGRFGILLAGGGTPERTYRLLAESESNWARWHVYFGDERCLPPADPQRNSLMAARVLTDRVPIPQNQIHPIPAELGPEPAALRYAEEIADALPFDLVLLGLGEDGHTASLFPGQAHPIGPAVLAVHQAPKPPPDRVSLSRETLASCRQLLFLVTGRGKRGAVQRWRKGENIPAAGIRGQVSTEVLIDRSAWGNHQTEHRDWPSQACDTVESEPSQLSKRRRAVIRRKIFFILALTAMTCLVEAADLVKKPSQKGVQETMDKLEAVVRQKGLTVFNRIDHQANARKAGLEQLAAQVLIFGSPKIGTAIMSEDPAAGLDLPLRVLVYQDKQGKTWISYHDPQALKQSYRVAGVPAVDEVTKALMGITDAAAK